MSYSVTSTAIPEVLILKPKVFEDTRGYLYESYSDRNFVAATGLNLNFVQDNHSNSKQGVLRGLHYQVQQAQGKLVRVTQGAVFDVAVDIRKSSSTFGKWVGCELNDTNQLQMWIPSGFAHGFLVLSETVNYLYKTTDYYAPAHERCIAWNDPNISINWPEGITPLLSAKDQQGLALAEAEVFA